MVALTGRNGGKLAEVLAPGDVHICVPAEARRAYRKFTCSRFTASVTRSTVSPWSPINAPLLTLVFSPSLPFFTAAPRSPSAASAARRYRVGEDRRAAARHGRRQAIEFKFSHRIVDKYPDAHVNATSYNRMVLLTGEAANAEMKATSRKCARDSKTYAVSTTRSDRPVTAFPARANDSLITSKVKARFVDARKFNAAARQGRDRSRHGLPDGHREAPGSQRRDRDRAHDERCAARRSRVRIPGLASGAVGDGRQHARAASRPRSAARGARPAAPQRSPVRSSSPMAFSTSCIAAT